MRALVIRTERLQPNGVYWWHKRTEDSGLQSCHQAARFIETGGFEWVAKAWSMQPKSSYALQTVRLAVVGLIRVVRLPELPRLTWVAWTSRVARLPGLPDVLELLE